MKFFYQESVFEKNYFDDINNNHNLNDLCLTDNTTLSKRKGVYITKVNQENKTFHLLRCSTNLSGPSEDCYDFDDIIINKVNELIKQEFPECENSNHVLAQVYYERSKIKSHSDKTKDMPKNSTIAFCSFYKDINHSSNRNPDDVAKIRFKHKITNEKIDYILYQGSVLIIDLEVNALYTHEIIPPVNDVVRLGYVVRSSNVLASYDDNNVYLDGKKIYYPSEEETQMIKQLYYDENIGTKILDYPRVHFSLNKGDQIPPLVKK